MGFIVNVGHVGYHYAFGGAPVKTGEHQLAGWPIQRPKEFSISYPIQMVFVEYLVQVATIVDSMSINEGTCADWAGTGTGHPTQFANIPQEL